MVRVTGLEPAHLSALEPKSNVSASFTTPAYNKSMQAKLACYGAPSGARTQDPLIKSQLLYQLS